MKKKMLLRTWLLMLPFLAMKFQAEGQECSYYWEVWSCYYVQAYYNAETIREQCECVSTGSVYAQQCPEGQVLACRHHKCKIECECMDLSDAAKWISRGNGCHNSGGSYWWGPPNGGGNGGNGGGHYSTPDSPTGAAFDAHRTTPEPYGASADHSHAGRAPFFSGLYPNPVSTQAILTFSLSAPQQVRIVLYDVNGREMSVLADQLYGSGSHEQMFNAETVPAGAYILQFRSKEMLHTQAVIVAK